MAGVYIDTSALGRILLGEPDAQLIRDSLAAYRPWWSSALLVVELRRLARRVGLEEPAERLLQRLRLVDVDRAVLERASRLYPVGSGRSMRSISTRRSHSPAGTRLQRSSRTTASFRPDARITASRSRRPPPRSLRTRGQHSSSAALRTPRGWIVERRDSCCDPVTKEEPPSPDSSRGQIAAARQLMDGRPWDAEQLGDLGRRQDIRARQRPGVGAIVVEVVNVHL